MKAVKGLGGVCTLSLVLFWAASACLQAQTNVLTYHNDNARTGQNTRETVLTPANVNSAQFGKLYSVNVDSYVYTQPLVLANVSIPGQGTHNVVYVATENDTLYAVDADRGAKLWQLSFINPSAGITTVPATDTGCSGIAPNIGITSTPVIDAGTGTIYLVALTKENGTYVQRLHAIDVATHLEKFGGPVVIETTVSGTGVTSQNGKLSFDPLHQNQRASLLLQNGHVIIAWGANTCDTDPFHGWVMSYSASTLSREAALCTTPNGEEGGVWLGGSGPAGDSKFIYFSTGNGDYDGRVNFGDSVLKIGGPSSGSFPLSDWFTPYNQNALRIYDLDLAAGGVLLLPDLPFGSTHQQLMVAVSKAGTIYLIDRNRMGKYCSTCTSRDTQIVQEIPNTLAGMWGAPAYWNGNVYFGGAHPNGAADNLKAFSFNANNSGVLSNSFTSESPEAFNNGPTPAVSSNGNADGIVWGLKNQDYASTCCHVLYAYDAINLAHELYNSSQAPNSRDLPGRAVKFTVPTIANGKVYVGSSSTLTIFGLLPKVKLSASSVTFSSPVAVGQTTTAKTVTLTNLGTPSLSITSVSVSGANPSDFSETNTCGSSLAAGANCSISVIFHPKAIGTRTASVLIADNGAGGPQTVALKGTGTYVKLSANGYAFPATTVGQRSTKTETLTNVGSSPLTISSISFGGANPSDFSETNNCGSSVAAGATCTLTLTFHPTATGTRSAVVSIIDNGGGSPQTISLSGTGQ
jgi:hypothetical protein